MASTVSPDSSAAGRKRVYVPAVGPRLRRVLMVVFALVSLLGANSAYLLRITGLEWATGQTYQNYLF